MGKPPRDLAPNLFRLAWRKNNTVVEDIRDQNWTRGLWRMSTADEMAEFIHLWDLIQNVQLLAHPDSIQWRTGDGRLMGATLRSWHICFSFTALSAPSMQKQFGRRMRKASNFFSRGYWFSPKFSQLTVCLQGIGHVIRFVCFAIKWRRRQPSCACTVCSVRNRSLALGFSFGCRHDQCASIQHID